jgi:hypothetical protein
LLRVALALAAGSAWGTLADSSRANLLLFTIALAAAWLSRRASQRIESGEPQRARPALDLGLLLLIAALGALRAPKA